MINTLRLFAKRLGQYTGLQRPIVRLWNTYEHIKFSVYVRRNISQVNAVATPDPFSIYYIDPDSIQSLSTSSFDFICDTGRSIGGDWDRNPNPITDTSKYQWFKHRFHEGIPWSETTYYQRQVEKIQRGQSDRYATIEEFESKLATYEELYRQFERDNYLLQSELVEKRPRLTPGDGGRALVPSLTDHTLLRHEIAVNIGRNGQFLRNDGRHRLALAQLAGLDEVPVRIVVRHAKWQQLRDQVARTVEQVLEADIPEDEVPEYVRAELTSELTDINHGLAHPDLTIVIKRRLKSNEHTSSEGLST